MKTATISSADLFASGRMDAAFHVLLATHKAVAERLAAKYDLLVLADMAKQLPFDKKAAGVIFWRGSVPQTPKAADLADKIRATCLGETPSRAKLAVALYCVAAAQEAEEKVEKQLAAIEAERDQLNAGLALANRIKKE